ncbi:MAG TPA: superoxide dismutase [Candidatus Ruminococcus gallistercoris]|nr:superoxide dismutase [Candidatus Ruminococcus gallistercoris]
MPFENTPLPYAFDALEPYIDARTMEIHHDRHLQAYIDGLNRAIAPFPALQNCTAARLAVLNAPALRCIRPALCRNAGGVFNHRFYFAGMTPDGSRRLPCGALQSAVLQTFGTQATFEDAFTKAALGVFGSGYVWLVRDVAGRPRIITTANQDTPMARGLRPLLCCDVWEHAYYLKHQNRRADYAADWLRVADWARANDIFTGAAPFSAD